MTVITRTLTHQESTMKKRDFAAYRESAGEWFDERKGGDIPIFLAIVFIAFPQIMFIAMLGLTYRIMDDGYSAGIWHLISVGVFFGWTLQVVDVAFCMSLFKHDFKEKFALPETSSAAMMVITRQFWKYICSVILIITGAYLQQTFHNLH